MARKKVTPQNNSPIAAGPSPEALPTTPMTEGNKGPAVYFQLADGSSKTKRRLKHDVSFDSVLSKTLSKLVPDVDSQQIRLSHVRANGREVDLIDDYDYVSFQRRALDNPSQTQTIKVYIPGSSAQNLIASSISIPEHPQIPSPAGSVNTSVNIFETPKGQPKRDRKGKQKADATISQSEVIEDTQQSQSATTPARGDLEISKSSKKRKQKTSEPIKLRASSSSFDSPSAADHPPSLTKNSISTSPTKNSLASPKKSKKRKRLSEVPPDFRIPLALPAPSTSSPAEDTSSSRERRSKSPEKKKRRKGKKDQDDTPVESPRVVQPSSALQIQLSSASPSVPPYLKLNKYKPVTPSPLGRMPSPSVDGEAEEDSHDGSPDVRISEELPKSPIKGKKKRKNQEKEKVKNQLEEQVENAETHTLVEESGESQYRGEEREEIQVDETAAKEEPKKRSRKAKKNDPVVETASEVQEPQAEPQVEAIETVDTPTQSKKAKEAAISKTKQQQVRDAPEIEVETVEKVPQVTEEMMEVDQEEQASPKVVTATSKKIHPKVKSAVPKDRKVIPLSSPYILYVRPNDPLPYITSRYNSSTIDRNPLKTYGKSVKSINPPAQDVEKSDDDAISLEEEELPKSPEPPKRAEVPQKKKRKSAPADEQNEKHREPAGTASSPLSSKQLHSPHSTTSTTELSKHGRHIPSEHHLNVDARGHCLICLGDPHLQINCPAVAKGLDHLRDLFEERKKDKNNPQYEDTMKAFDIWINRADKIASSITGAESPSDHSITNGHEGTSSSTPDQPLALSPNRKSTLSKEEVVISSTSAARTVVRSPPPPMVNLESDQQEDADPEAEPRSAPSTPSEEVSDPELPASPLSPTPGPAVAPVRPSQQSQSAQSPSREHSAPPIYLKALATKAGSVSGLSVSDAVIETGSSESESDSDNGSGSVSDSDSDAESNSLRGSESSHERSQRRSRSRSPASIARSPSPSLMQDSGSLGTPSLNDFMSMPLSQKLKQRARASAAGMMEVELDEEIQDESDNESNPERQLPPASFAGRARRGSESSVGEFADEKSDEDADMEEDEVLSFTQSIPVQPIQEEQADTIETAPEETRKSDSPPPSDQSKRSFTDLADVSSPTPIVAEFPGSIALQEAIDEDDAQERGMDVDTSARPEESKTGHIISQGLMSPPSSTGEDLPEEPSEPMPATQIVNGDAQDDQATPKPLNRRVTRGKARDEAELAPPIDIRLSSSQPTATTTGRRLRSMSRELSAEPMSPRRTTRRVSSSQPEPASRMRSTSPPSILPARRNSKRTTPSSQIDELASSPAVPLRRSSRRGSTPLRSSQPDQLESSPQNMMRTPAPIAEEDESEVDESEPQQTPEESKPPLVPETQESLPRRGLRTKPSPLFMSQGSQIPQTQAYNIYPNLPSSDAGASIDETPKGRTNGVVESPLSSRKTNKLGRKASLRFTSPIVEDIHEEEDADRAVKVKDSQPQDESDHDSDKYEDGTGEPALSAGSASGSESEDEIAPVPLPKLRSSRSTPSLYPGLPKPKALSSSQPQPTAPIPSAFPALSALSKDFITRRASFGIGAGSQHKTAHSRMSLPANGFSKSQPNPKSDDESDSGSGSDSDSSEEEKTPAGLKGRFAKGGREKKKRVSASQPNIGW
ncbi:hypothetical protein V865_007638 [Kwoniella europaea PYCC6329]|uniref:Nucleolar protein Dnt1-like N-terminal domain-containing protein n=1 Tax=Kwoniella europaea PYCC6329 TaxID=1423913 RepID=A0AAX4KSY0_9TREE